jgi:polar amino acid transport system substrate-binding protein
MFLRKIIGCLIACGSIQAMQPDPGVLFPDIKKLIERKKLVVAIYKEENPPFFYTENGDTKGIDVDIAKSIAAKIHPDIEVVINRTPVTFNDVVDIVSRGEADIGISFLSYTAQRSRKVFYTKSPYIIVRTALLINRTATNKSAEENTLKELFSAKNKNKICVIEGSSYVDMAKRIFPDAELYYSKTSDDLLKDLKDDRCIALLEDDQAIYKRLIQHPQINLVYQSVTLEKEKDPINIVINSEYPHLADFIEHHIFHSAEFPMDLNKVLRDNEELIKKF